MRFGSLPRSMAIRTALWTESSGVMTRSGLDASDRLLVLQTRTQTAQPRQNRAATLASFFLGCKGSLAETRLMASTGQTAAHSPQPVQEPLSTTGMKFVV